LKLEPGAERDAARYEKNDKRVAQIAEKDNNYWSLKPNYRNSGKFDVQKLANQLLKLAGFNPFQKRGKDGQWVDDNMSENVNDKLQNEFPNLTIDIYQNDQRKTLTLSRVIVPENFRDGGLGTKFMKSLIKKADKLAYKIILTPSDDFGGNKNRLIEFYKKFGFILNKGEDRDFSHREDMYRLPK
jgi:predicted GNAT family acetyltransferase